MSGYSGTPLAKKLGIKPGHKVFVMNEPGEYWDWLSPLPENVQVVKRPTKPTLDFVHLFVSSEKVFEKEVVRLRKLIVSNGMIWISWPKKSSGVPSDLDENAIRNFALNHKLVDVKVCAVNETWSGLKLVIPVKWR